MPLIPTFKHIRNQSLIIVVPPVPGNPSDVFYQSTDFDRPVDTSRFESPFDSPRYGLSRSPLELSGTSTPWIDAIGSAVSTGPSVPASQAGDVQLNFDGTDFLQADYPIGQGDDKIAMVPESSLAMPFPDVPLPQILEPTCPAGKKAYCCSGGKAANNIGKGCGECIPSPLFQRYCFSEKIVSS